jgi:hypothetical protein
LLLSFPYRAHFLLVLARDGPAGAVTLQTGSIAQPPSFGAGTVRGRLPYSSSEGVYVGSVIKKRRKRMAKKKHRKLLKKTRIQRRNKK